MELWYYRANATKRREAASRDQIRTTIEGLDTRIHTSEARQVEFTQSIKASVRAKNKTKARSLLLQQKRSASQLKMFYAHRDDLESVLISLDESNEQQELVASFRDANRVLKSNARGDLVGKFEDLSDDLAEAQADVEEVNQAMASRVAVQDADVEEEMNELFDEPKQETVPPPPPPTEGILLPAAPTTAIDLILRSKDEVPVGIIA